MSNRAAWALLFAATAFAAAPNPATAQNDLGQKLLGGTGINAGVQTEPGLYIVDRFLTYHASTVVDRNGDALPVADLEIAARGNMLGLAWILKPAQSPYLTFAAGIPWARVSISSTRPETALDRYGFGDAFVQPIKVGWREPNYDIVAGYTVYVPTGKFEPRKGGVGRGFWTHQLSIGGALFAPRDRRWRASALLSYDINSFKRDIDIKRGNTVQVQGGAGAVAARGVVIGLAGFALWQVSDDRGSDLPVPLRGLRTRVFGLGPELNVAILPTRVTLDARFELEFGARSRSEGNVLSIGLSYRTHR